MKRITVVMVALLAGALLASASYAATSGTSTVTLAATATATINVLDPALTLTPTTTDYDNDFVEATGAAGLRVNVKTNSSTGMVLFVRCADAVPQIQLADLLLRTQTPAGGGGTTMGTYIPVTAVNQSLWTTTTSQHPWATVTTDVRVQNLFNYDDAITAGATNYTNTLTYSVVVQ